MNRKLVVAAVALVAALAIPSLTWGHGGHVHKVMGTVSAVSAVQLQVKATDGKTVTVALDAKTVYRRGKAKADVKMLTVGDRVVIEATEDEAAKTMTAKTVQMAAPPAAAAEPGARAPAQAR